MVYYTLKEEILEILKKESVSSREEIARNLKQKPNRAILMGYLRCLVDLGVIESKDAGKAKIYFIGKRGKQGKGLDTEIFEILKKRGFCSREEITSLLKEKPNRAILMGYLRCLVDLGIIESKDAGRAKIYFLKRGERN